MFGSTLSANRGLAQVLSIVHPDMCNRGWLVSIKLAVMPSMNCRAAVRRRFDQTGINFEHIRGGPNHQVGRMCLQPSRLYALGFPFGSLTHVCAMCAIDSTNMAMRKTHSTLAPGFGQNNRAFRVPCILRPLNNAREMMNE